MNGTDHLDEENDEEFSDDEDQEEEQIDLLGPVQSLFSEESFANVIEMFRSLESKFNLVEFIEKHRIVSQYDYIRLINFIRTRKPTIEQLKQIEPSENAPWQSEEFFQTVIENDPALQFDIEEDLNQLGGNSKIENDPLAKANERIRQLEEMIGMFKSMAARFLQEEKSTQIETTTEEETSKLNVEDDGYFATYDHYDIHKEMLQDVVRTESYLNAIKKNVDLFRDKIVLDVGCGTGILSMACLRYGEAKLVIAVDMSDIIYDAMAIAKENNIDESKLVFLRGRIEDVKLPVDKVDIIISEWMGYFLLFECMLESVIFARNHYLAENGLVLPDDFSIHLSAFHSESIFHENVAFWSNVYGFEMNTVSKSILSDGQVMIVPVEDLMTNNFCIKTLDIYNCSNDDIAFSSSFSLKVEQTGSISGFVSYFDVDFSKNLIEKVHFSTSPRWKNTHWKQTVFLLPRVYSVQKDEIIEGKIVCQRHSKEKRSLIINLLVFDSKFKFFLE